MKILLQLLGLTALPGSVWAQAPVTFADLDGAAIEARIIRQQVVRRDGRDIPVTHQNNVRLIVGPGDKIDMMITPTVRGPRGQREGQTRRSSHILERPRALQGLGGGHGVYIFSGGVLTFLRTYKGGAFKRVIAFARRPEGLTCTASETFARENGSGSIVLDSGIDGREVEIVSAKPVSSTCRIAKQTQPPTTQ